MALSEKQLEAQRRYRAQNRDALLLRQRAYQQKNAARRNAQNAQWIRENRAKYNAAKARYRLKLKREVMGLYGPVRCAHCGFGRLDGLVLDHINDDGAAHRKAIGVSHRGSVGSGMRIYEYIHKNGKVDGLQVLCANCNTIKQIKKNRRESIKDTSLLAEIEAISED